MNAVTEQLFQIGVKGLIRNNAGEILMVHLSAWKDKPAYWDLPGGRMNPGENFLDTLARELHEETGLSFAGVPEQLSAFLSSATVPVGDEKIPLVLVIYKVEIPGGATVKLDPISNEDAYDWFTPAEAADNLSYKFSAEFCQQIRSLASV